MKVLVTGASRGIGRAIAVGIAERHRGATVGIGFRVGREGAEETAHLVRAVDGNPLLVEADVADVEEQSGLVGTSLALMNLLLMAHALGLGASGMTGPLVAEPALRAILEVSDGWGIVALVPVGWPDEDPTPTDRKPVEKVIRFL